MALPHKSIATIDSPEFINLTPLDINPMMSKCEIKVLYLGGNRNGSFITKDVATEMSKSLRGAPIVGYFREDKQDFRDHGHKMVWDDEGIHFECMTVPYGFVAPDAQVWFQKFQEEDDFGNEVEREYLMTTGFLWTGQFEEAQSVIDEGKPQSMELDENSLQGHWAENTKNGMEFFIISDAIFTKLCILGDDVEPCFEGAAVTAPDVSANFSKDVDDKFRKTLFDMMKELQYALKGEPMANVVNTEVQSEEVPTQVVENTTTETETSAAPATEMTEETQDNSVEENTSENQDNVESQSTGSEEFKQNDDKDEENKDENEGGDSEEDDEEDDDKKKYALLESKLAELESKFTALESEASSLREFKANVDGEKKDELIAQFYMLSDEDKKDVIEHKAEYSLDDIKAKLSVICFEKKVSFVKEDNSENQNNVENNPVVFNMNNDDSSTPDWVKAVKETEKGQI